MHNIFIREAERGLIVEVGCCIFVYGDSEKEKSQLAKDLKEYLLDPEGVEKRYWERKGTKNTLINPTALAPTPAPADNPIFGQTVRAVDEGQKEKA